MHQLKKVLKGFLSPQTILFYHRFLALFGNVLYFFPSHRMVVIGVTGTKGKTSTANFIWAALSASSSQVGLISTANMRIGEKETLNKYHMTMPGRFTIPKLMRQMRSAGCRFCVVEVTSEGIKQWRHAGINFDVVVFTNLTPEHLQSHEGSFEKYRETKGKLFEGLMQSKRKSVFGREVQKIIIVNNDSPEKKYFLNFPADKKITFGLFPGAVFTASSIDETMKGVSFECAGAKYELAIPGRFNVANALPALIIAKIFNVSSEAIQRGFDYLDTIPGRMERINAGQNFAVFVDYAHEKESMTGLLESAAKMRTKSIQRIILLLGAEGGGRDKAKRGAMGEVAGKMADYIVVSNVDPYDDNPADIADDITRSVLEFGIGKFLDKDVFVVLDRQEGIRKALSLAKPGDIVLITGKGAEQSMILAGGKTIPWDDRDVVRDELERLKSLQ